MKDGCLGCHFISLFSIGRDGHELNPLPSEYRDKDAFLKLLQKLDPRMRSVKCFREMWDAEKIGFKNSEKIEETVFRKDRGKKCPLFSLYDSHASLKAAMERNRRIEEVIDRKVTRRMALAAIIISAVATIISILPIILSK